MPVIYRLLSDGSRLTRRQVSLGAQRGTVLAVERLVIIKDRKGQRTCVVLVVIGFLVRAELCRLVYINRHVARARMHTTTHILFLITVYRMWRAQMYVVICHLVLFKISI